MPTKRIRYIPSMEGYKPCSFSFKTTKETLVQQDTVALSSVKDFFELIALGKSFPNEMIVSALDLETILACTFFISPFLVTSPQAASLSYSFHLINKWGYQVASAHVPEEHDTLIRALATLVSINPIEEEEDALAVIFKASLFVESYLTSGELPELDNSENKSTIRYFTDASPFVAFSAASPCWKTIYQKGYLFGIWFSSTQKPIVFRKSLLVEMPFSEIAQALNEKEFDIPMPKGMGWVVSDDCTTILPPTKNPIDGSIMEGTKLACSAVISVVHSFCNCE